jgi:hypothetical protein
MVTLACVFGCSKREKTPAMKRSAEIPDISKTAPKNSDTTDIFKEFYSDDTAQKNPAKKQNNKSVKAEPKNRTFSPATAGASAAEFSEKGRYVVQVSCVKSRAYAKKMAEGLKEKGYPAYVAEVENPTPSLSGDYYRVRIGGFLAYSAAKAFGENTLSQSGLQYWVDKKANDKVGIEGSGLGGGPANPSATSSYENAATPAASSSWSTSTPSSSAPATATSSPTTSSQAASATNGAAAPSVPSAEPAPSASPAASEKSPVAPEKTTTAPSAAPAASPAPASSAPAAPVNPSATATAPAAATAQAPKSAAPASSGNEWGSDTSASGSGW